MVELRIRYTIFTVSPLFLKRFILKIKDLLRKLHIYFIVTLLLFAVDTDSLFAQYNKSIDSKALAAHKLDSIKFQRALFLKQVEVQRKKRADSIANIQRYKLSRHYRDSITKKRLHKADSIKQARLAILDELKQARLRKLDSINLLRNPNYKPKARPLTNVKSPSKKFDVAKNNKRYNDSLLLMQTSNGNKSTKKRLSKADSLQNVRKLILAEKAAGVSFIKMENGAAVFEIGSGDYHFVSNLHYKAGIVKDAFIFERSSFPESHASTIAETPKGLIAAWFGGTKEGYKDVCIWTSNYNNGVWSAPKKIADGIIDDSTRHPCYNPVLYQVPGGDLLLFYKIGPNVAGWKGYMIRSSDHGITWSKRESLPDGFLGPIKNKPVLINDVLICGSSTEKTGWKVHFEYTKDWGKTWTKSEDINDGKTISAIQPSILKYKDGRLQILSRSKNTTLNQSWSADNGITWSPMTASNLPNNNSGTDAVTLQDGRQLLVYNHAMPNASWVNGKGPRTPLNVAISEDGINWNAAVILEDSPVSQYSYPSVIQTKDGLVHIVYTWRRERIKHVILDPKKLQTKKIVNGVWPSPIRNFGSTINEE